MMKMKKVSNRDIFEDIMTEVIIRLYDILVKYPLLYEFYRIYQSHFLSVIKSIDHVRRV